LISTYFTFSINFVCRLDVASRQSRGIVSRHLLGLVIALHHCCTMGIELAYPAANLAHARSCAAWRQWPLLVGIRGLIRLSPRGLLTGREDARIEAVLASTKEAYVDLAKIGPFWRRPRGLRRVASLGSVQEFDNTVEMPIFRRRSPLSRGQGTARPSFSTSAFVARFARLPNCEPDAPCTW
jgi:hypothetical protein